MNPNLMLHVAAYPDPDSAGEDFAVIDELQADAGVAIIAAVVVNREDDGQITVKEHGATATSAGATVGGLSGLAVGLFAPPLLLSTAIGAAIGGTIGELVKRHEEKQLGVELEEYLPVGSSAVLVIADDMYADKIDRAFTKASKKVSKAIDKNDYDKLVKALDDAGFSIAKAIKG